MTTPRFQRDIYISVVDGKVTGWSSSSFSPSNEVKLTVARDHGVLENPHHYRYLNNVLTYDPVAAETAARIQNERQNAPTTEQMVTALVGTDPKPKALEAAAQFNQAVLMFAQTLPDEKALEIPEIFPLWEIGKDYAVNTTLRYGVDAAGKSQLYKVLQAHKSQANWLPKDVPAMYKAVSFTEVPGGGSIANWVQPVGAVDAYKINDIVMHKTKKWKSTANGNVWEPGVYGWVVVT